MSRPTRIKAKYDGHCYRCHAPIHKGDNIVWYRHHGVWHPACYDKLGGPPPEDAMEKTVDRPSPYFGPQRKRLSRTWP